MSPYSESAYRSDGYGKGAGRVSRVRRVTGLVIAGMISAVAIALSGCGSLSSGDHLVVGQSGAAPSTSTSLASKTIPDLLTLSVSAANSKLRTLGAPAVEVSDTVSSPLPTGVIVSQSPPVGTPLPLSTPITVQISSGVPPTTSVVGVP